MDGEGIGKATQTDINGAYLKDIKQVDGYTEHGSIERDEARKDISGSKHQGPEARSGINLVS